MINRRDFLKWAGLGAAAVVGGCESLEYHFREKTPLEKAGLEEIADNPSYGSRIAFVAEPSNNKKDLWIVNPDGSNLKKLFSGLYHDRVQFSPNGQYLALATERELSTIPGMAVLNRNGKIIRDFNCFGIRSEEDFIWLPDGKNIAFGFYCDGINYFDLNKVDAYGSILRQKLTKDVPLTYNHNPAVSPDGKTLAFVHHEWGKSASIWTVNLKSIEKEPSYSDKIYRHKRNGFEFIDGYKTGHDEDLSLCWLDNENLIFSFDSKKKIFLKNVETDQEKIIIPETQFTSFKVSPDRNFLAVYDSQGVGQLSFADINELGKTQFSWRLPKMGQGVNAFDWSANPQYFAVARDKKIEIYDRTLQQYAFDLPKEDFGTINNIVWSPGFFTLGPLVKK